MTQFPWCTFAAAVACFSVFLQSIYDSQPTTTVVPNRLSSVRELLHEQLRAWLPKFCVAVSNCDDPTSGMPTSVFSWFIRTGRFPRNPSSQSLGSDCISSILFFDKQSLLYKLLFTFFLYAFHLYVQLHRMFGDSWERSLSTAACIQLRTGGDGDEKSEAVAHPGYEVERPFTMLRYVLVGVILEIVNRDPQQLDVLPVELWKVLCSWFFRYPHNNLYHSVFYKLVFKALRCNNEGALRMAVSKARLVAQLVDSHIDGDKVSHFDGLCLHGVQCRRQYFACKFPRLGHTSEFRRYQLRLAHAYRFPLRNSYDSAQSAGNRGYVLQLCNAFRLQADTMPPTDFLRTYLNSHEQWRNFLGSLREATLEQQTPGLGFEVSKAGFGSDTRQGTASRWCSIYVNLLGEKQAPVCIFFRIADILSCKKTRASILNEDSATISINHAFTCRHPRRCQVPAVPRYYSNGPETLGNQPLPEDSGIDHG